MIRAQMAGRGQPPTHDDDNAGERVIWPRVEDELSSSSGSAAASLAGPGRLLTPEERQNLRERRQARVQTQEMPSVDKLLPSTRKRVPRMPRPTAESTVRSRGLVALGAILVVVLAALAFGGARVVGPPRTVESGPIAAGLGDDRGSASGDDFPVGRGPGLPTPVSGVTGSGRVPIVCLDPGHGGGDNGFMSSPLAPLPLREATLVLEQAWELEARLTQRGYTVVLTRRTDVTVNATGADVNGDGKTGEDDLPGSTHYGTLDELQARINVCNEAGADLLISMHVNGYTTGKPRGYETWYTAEREFGDRNAEFATFTYRRLKEQLANVGYVLPESEERGVQPDTKVNVLSEHAVFDHFVLTGPAVEGAVAPSQMPGAIVEALFLSNDTDAAVLVSREGRHAIVTAYEMAIVDYFAAYPLAS